jgi:Ca2+-binding RTX toxin-like protein
MTESVGTGNDDLIDGTDSDDVIRGRAGDDRLRGRLGDDEIHGDAGDDTVTGNEGDDVLYGGDGFDQINGNDGDDTAHGGNQGDRIYGHDGNDILNGDGGDDTIYGGNDNDIISGGTGKDRLYGDAGADVIDGGADNDKLFGGDGNDILRGGDGNDGLNGKADDDTLYGGAGNDSLNGNVGNDALYGEDGDDRLYGHEGSDTLDGGAGADSLFGGDGNDTLHGGTGDDYLDGGADNDTLNGDAGSDTLKGRAGNDTLNGGDGNDTVTGNEGDDTLYGGDGHDNINGNDGNDTAHGGNQGDRIYGHAGEDSLNGDGGDDTIYGGDDNDTINGGTGKDRLYGDAGDDTIDGGSENDKLFGGDGNDILRGGDGNDGLNGKADDDTLYGGAGNDSLNGNIGDDTLYGEDGTDRLYGHDGADLLDGGAGNDALFGGDQGDTLRGGTGDDYIDGERGNDTLYGGDGDDVLKGRVGDDTLYGGAGDDTLNGGDGTNDHAVFSGKIADYELTFDAGTGQTRVVDLRDGSADGTDTVLETEYLDFTDGTVEVGVGGLTVNYSPVFYSPSAVTVAENQSSAYLTAVIDPDDFAILYSLSGTDAGLFSIDANTGEILFRETPTLVSPQDVDNDNVYDVIVTASDGVSEVQHRLAISVTDAQTAALIDYLYDGETPPFDLSHITTRPASPSVSERINVESDFSLAVENGVIGADGPTELYYVQNNFSFENNGVIWNEGIDQSASAIRSGNGVSITNNGQIIALSIDGFSRGIFSSYDTLLQNNGVIVAISTHSHATGFQYHGNSTFENLTATNTGSIEAAAGTLAVGVNLGRGGKFNNSGIIRAHGKEDATGVFAASGDTQITNSGLIDAGTDATNSVGIEMTYEGDLSVLNTGIIRADTAIYNLTTAGSLVSITNADTGQIQGDIVVEGAANSVIVNHGVIEGNIVLGLGVDSFTQVDGQLDGTLNLGGGNDVAWLNASDDVIYGGDGDDEIHAGDGDDTISGGQGADEIDGGSGSDTADYSGSNVGVSVNLSNGDTFGGDASGDILIEVENLAGSNFDDHLIGTGSNNRLRGNGGNDVFQGGGGSDTIFGGDGVDTVIFSGTEADYAVVLNADGSQTFTDQRSDAPDGSITLTNVERLEFSDKTVGPALPAPVSYSAMSFLFGAGETPWAPLPIIRDRPEGLLESEMVTLAVGFKLREGEVLMSSDGPPVLLLGPNPNASLEDVSISLENDGLIWTETSSGDATALGRSDWLPVINRGEIVALSKTGDASVIYTPNAASLENYGSVVAISATGDARALYARSAGNSFNEGEIRVWAGDRAQAIYVHGGDFQNSGVISAVGLNGAKAFTSGTRSLTFNNSGLIEAESKNGWTIGIGVSSSSGYFTNSGIVHADVAFVRYDLGKAYIRLNNLEGGRLEGDIISNESVDTVINDGLITGNVYLLDFSDSYTQTHGRLEGFLDLGSGSDTASINSGNVTIFGGDGDDQISAGDGDNRIVGGQGADVIQGGAGIDTADYSTSNLGVTVNLADGSAHNGDASGDSLSNIEHLEGSNYQDRLVGSTADNRLSGNGGNDIFVGGGGNDIILGGDGVDTVVFSGNRADYSVTDNADGTRTFDDLRAGSPDGSVTLDSVERLEFADITEGPAMPPPITHPASDFLFTTGDTPWSPLPDIPDRPDGATDASLRALVADFTLQSGEAIISSNSSGYLFGPDSNRPDVTNNGLIWNENSTSSVAGFSGYNWGTITNNGDIVILSTTGESWPPTTGISISAHGLVDNQGRLIVVSESGDAVGFTTYDGGGFFDHHINAGTMQVWAGGDAIGAQMQNSGNFKNHGLLQVTGVTDAVAVFAQTHRAFIRNSGVIEANSRETDSIAVHLRSAGDSLLENSGSIRADIALFADFSYDRILTITNTATGIIEGDIYVDGRYANNGPMYGGSIDTLTNAGSIIGDIHLGVYDDTYNGADGTLDGTLDLGSGDDVAVTGAGDETVLGGEGDDRFIASLGADFFDGGAGTDTIVFSGSAGDYTLTVNGAGNDVYTDNRSGSGSHATEIANVENVEFDGGSQAPLNPDKFSGSQVMDGLQRPGSADASVDPLLTPGTGVSINDQGFLVLTDLDPAPGDSGFSPVDWGLFLPNQPLSAKWFGTQQDPASRAEAEGQSKMGNSGMNHYLSDLQPRAPQTAFDPDYKSTPSLAEPFDFPADITTTAVIAVGGEFLANLNSSSDSDWFKIELEADVEYVFSVLRDASAQFDPQIRVYDENGNLIAQERPFDNPLALDVSAIQGRLPFSTQTDGTYFIEISSGGEFGFGDYTLKAMTPGPDDLPEDVTTTALLEVGSSYSDTLEIVADRDWIAVELEAGKAYEFSLTGTGATPLSQPLIRLMEGDAASSNFWGVRVGTNRLGEDGTSTQQYFVQTNGTYYIEVGSAYTETNQGYPYADALAGDYRLSVDEIEIRDFSIAEMANYLTTTYWTDFAETTAHAFDTSSSNVITVDITALTAHGAEFAIAALGLWSDAADIVFSFVLENAQITFDDQPEGGFTTASWDDDGHVLSATVNVATWMLTEDAGNFSTQGFSTYVHEIGHALGLGHAGPYNGEGASFEYDFAFRNESKQTSIMSYVDAHNNWTLPSDWAVIVTPQLADIYAVQQLYGAPVATRSGDTVYGTTNSTGNPIFDLIDDRYTALTLVDSGGNDTIDMSGANAPVSLDLQPGALSSVAQGTANLAIAVGTVIENAVGTNWADTLLGNSAANTISGGSGSDLLDGRAGNDRLLGGAENDVIRGGDGADTVTGHDGDDTLYGDAGADKINGNDGDDTAYGGDQADRIYGHAGADTLYAGSGDDTVYGGADNDAIYGAAGNDRLYGDEGEDLINGGGGNDKLFGGDGIDTISGGTGNDGLNGKAGDDQLSGGDGNDGLNGNIGNDTVNGDAGSDRVYGHQGTDTLNGGSGNDFMFGGDDDDAMNGDGDNDYMDGGDGADTMHGGDGVDVVKGRDGNDTLRGGAGNDTVNGGSGDDVIIGGSGDDKLVGSSGADTHVFGPAWGDDRIVDFVSGTDMIDLTGLGLKGAGESNADAFAKLSFVRVGAGGRDTVISVTGDSANSILVEGVKPVALTAASFVFEGGIVESAVMDKAPQVMDLPDGFDKKLPDAPVMDGVDDADTGFDIASLVLGNGLASGNGLALARDPHGFLSLLETEDLSLDALEMMSQLDAVVLQDWRADLPAAVNFTGQYSAPSDHVDLPRPDHDEAGFAVISEAGEMTGPTVMPALSPKHQVDSTIPLTGPAEIDPQTDDFITLETAEGW